MSDISPTARSIARIIDRHCRNNGTYIIMIDIPDDTDPTHREHWTIRLYSGNIKLEYERNSRVGVHPPL